MVNEVNKPPGSQDQSNDQLGQRLAASNQALAEMQAEHRQLLEEMEQLRRRAEGLQRLREQQDREDQERERQYQATLQENESSNIVESNEVVQDTLTSEQPSAEAASAVEVEAEDENPEEAEYIKEKLAEIARLKAQFKRVQHMINTTDIIEKHISKNEETETTNQSSPVSKTAVPEAQKVVVPELPKVPAVPKVPTNVSEPTTAINETNIAALLALTQPEEIAIPNMPSMADLNAASTQDEKEQLLHTMLSMFEGFSSDLKSQADNLRAERERIRALKESIIRSRQQPPK